MFEKINKFKKFEKLLNNLRVSLAVHIFDEKKSHQDHPIFDGNSRGP